MKPNTSALKKYFQEIPPSVRRFLITSIILFSIWKITYHFYLKPTRLIDIPLTVQTAKNTQQLLSVFYPMYNFTSQQKIPVQKIDFFGVYVMKDSKRIIGIFDPCNALEIFIIYIGFIICLPSNFKRMALYIIFGIIGLYILNILRCSVLGILNLNRSNYVDFAHHYIFTMVVYIGIFLGWASYIKQSTNEV
jgi:exosortase family protein XrtF